jgi:hypothetical protein
VSQVPALWRGEVCHASPAAMAATIRAATRSACHQPSVSHRARAVSQQAGRRPDAAESAVALQCPAGHPPAESAGRMWIVLLALLLRFRPCLRGFGLVGA